MKGPIAIPQEDADSVGGAVRHCQVELPVSVEVAHADKGGGKGSARSTADTVVHSGLEGAIAIAEQDAHVSAAGVDHDKILLSVSLEVSHRRGNRRSSDGNAYLSSGRSAEALHAHQEAIRLDPNYATTYLNLAVFYLHSGQADQARPYYQKACRLDRELCRQVESKFH